MKLDENSIPREIKLFQNYPNPFNAETIIQYSVLSPNGLLRSRLHVTLRVFDLLGREFATLVDEVKETGIHSSTLSTLYSPLPSGVYFYQLRIGSYVETKKMIYLK